MRDTECFSIYSDISSRIMHSSEPNSSSARVLHSSVFPTPVGPRKRKDAAGRCGSFRPTRERRIARETALTASGCPMTRLERFSSRESSRRDWSDLGSRRDIREETSMPVLSETIWAISEAVTGRFLQLCRRWSCSENSVSFSRA